MNRKNLVNLINYGLVSSPFNTFHSGKGRNVTRVFINNSNKQKKKP